MDLKGHSWFRVLPSLGCLQHICMFPEHLMSFLLLKEPVSPRSWQLVCGKGSRSLPVPEETCLALLVCGEARQWYTVQLQSLANYASCKHHVSKLGFLSINVLGPSKSQKGLNRSDAEAPSCPPGWLPEPLQAPENLDNKNLTMTKGMKRHPWVAAWQSKLLQRKPISRKWEKIKMTAAGWSLNRLGSLIDKTNFTVHVRAVRKETHFF